MLVDRHQRGDAAPLSGGFHPVGVLGNGLTAGVVELDDAVVDAVGAALVHHRALQHGEGVLAVRRDREAFEAAVGATADIAVAVIVVAAGRQRRAQCLRRVEGADHRAAAVEFIQRRTVFVRHQQVAGQRVDHDAFRVEGGAQIAGRTTERARELAAEHSAGAVTELDRIDHLEVGDRTGAAIDVEREALDAHVVGQRAAARATVRQTPPFVAVGVVVDVGEHAEPAVVHAAAEQITGGARNGDAIDEGDGGCRCSRDREQQSRCQ